MLAKELGLETQELIDRIQGWGLAVKPSALAGVDHETADDIRRRSRDSNEPQPSKSSPVEAPTPKSLSPTPKSPTAEARAISPAHVSNRPSGDHSSAPNQPTQSSANVAPGTAAAHKTEPEPASTSGRPEPAPAPSTTTPSSSGLERPSEPPAEPPRPDPRLAGPPRGATSPPKANAGDLSPRGSADARPPSDSPQQRSPSRQGGGGGPLAGHTRMGRPGGDSPTGADRPIGTSGPAQNASGGSENRQRSLDGGQPPRKSHDRQDYMSPSGTRTSSGGPNRQSHQSHRRDGATTTQSNAGGGNQGPRRDGQRSGSGRPLPPLASGGSNAGRPLPPVASVGNASGRPLPPVAQSSGQGKRTGGPGATPPRPSEGAAGSGSNRSVQPEKRFTREQMLEMKRRGQIGNSPAGRAPASAPPRDGSGGPEKETKAPPTGPKDRPQRGIEPPVGPTAAPSTRGSSTPGRGRYETDDEERRGKGPGGRLGGATDRAGRRAKRQERAKDRVTSPMPAVALLDADDDGGRRRGPKKRQHRQSTVAPRKTSATIELPITLRSLSEEIGIKANQLMRKVMEITGELASINETIDEEMAMELALEFGVELAIAQPETAEDHFDKLFEDASQESDGDENALELRPPVVTILGHVDHGKTSLLDYIRSANVVAGESGGITQHIGAYQIEHEGRKVTFVDTPGHEAFTAMRARGANVTDIAVIVAAADDGVMPQTKEAIAHAKAAGVQIVVALNKIDLPGAEDNINRILGELSAEELIPEEYGGDVPVVRTSAISGQGIDELLEYLATLAEINGYKANPSRPATGTCLESELSEGRGVVATVLVQDGTLKVGDTVACGEAFGRVRALRNDQGRSISEAGPSTPVEISGLDAVPTAGEKFAALVDIAKAREVAETRRTRTRGETLGESPAITLENLYSKMAEHKVKSLNVILKADVQGSLEALLKELEKLENDEVPIRVLLRGVGGISESDVMLADASEAIVIGFRVAPEDRAITLADEKKIEIRRYDIIYQVTDEIKQAIEGRLEPEIKEHHLGRAVVRQTFKISGVGTVAGCFVTQGTIQRNAQARIIREGREIYKGTLDALKRFKDDVREVRENFECGIKIAKFDDIKVDDVIEAFRLEVIRRTL